MHCALLILIACQAAGAQRIAADEAAFRKKVAPIFQRRCLSCHNEDDFKGDLPLETRARIGEAGVVVPGDPGSSHLFKMIAWQEGKRPEMPKDADPLTEEEIVAIRGWIVSGAKWPAASR